jgi:hypothetical protein
VLRQLKTCNSTYILTQRSQFASLYPRTSISTVIFYPRVSQYVFWLVDPYSYNKLPHLLTVSAGSSRPESGSTSSRDTTYNPQSSETPSQQSHIYFGKCWSKPRAKGNPCGRRI